jgi:multiple sugar transport system ATP-binding protein
MAKVKLAGVRKSFGAVEIIKGIDLEIDRGQMVVVVGPSGCGKSTLLRMIAGLEDITSGMIEIDGRVVNDVPPAERQIAMVFQSYALYPHKSVRENIGFGLRMAKVDKAVIAQKVDEAAKVLEIESLLDRRPKDLSGGQRQRVAIGRAIVRNPQLFLFDEPLSNLDAALRGQMRIEIARLHQALDTTMIYVTHDQVEAMTLADRIVVLNGGKIEQVGRPLELYDHPSNLFVATFIGSPKMNLIPGKVVAIDGTNLKIGLSGSRTFEFPALCPAVAIADDVTVGVRPTDLSEAVAELSFDAKAEVVEHLGAETHVLARLASGETVIARLGGRSRVMVDDIINVGASISDVHLFNSAGLAIENARRSSAGPPDARSAPNDVSGRAA